MVINLVWTGLVGSVTVRGLMRTGLAFARYGTWSGADWSSRGCYGTWAGVDWSCRVRYGQPGLAQSCYWLVQSGLGW